MNAISKIAPKKRSYFKRIFITYILLLIIPSVLIISTFYYTSQTYRRSVFDNTSLTLSNLISPLDNQLYQMAQIKDSILLNSAFIKSISRSSATQSSRYTYIPVKDYLDSLLTSDYNDIFIYYRGDDTIVPAYTSVTDSLSYYRTLYRGSDMAYETWLDQISNYKSETYSLVTMPDGTQTILYTCLSPYFSGKRDQDHGIYINFVLDPSRLWSLLNQNTIYDSPTDITLYMPDGTPLLSTNPSFVQEVPSFADGLVSHTFSSGTYAVSAETSDTTGFQYVIYFPMDLYRQPLNRFYVILMILFLIFVILSGFACILFTRYTYSPISKLMAKVQTSYPSKIPLSNEFDTFQNAFDSILEEKQKLAKRLNSESDHLVGSIMTRAFHHILPEGFYLKNALANLNVNLPYDTECIGILELYSDIPADFDMASVLESRLYDTSDSPISFLVFQTDTRRYAIVFNFSPDTVSMDAAADSVRKAMDVLSKESPLLYTMGISDPLPLSEIHTAYSQALQTLEYQSICGIHSIQMYGAVKAKRYNYNHNAMKLSYNKLKVYISAKTDVPTALETYTEIRNSCFHEAEASSEVFQCFRYDMINTLLKVASDYRITAKDHQLVENLLHTTTIPDLDEAIVRSLEQIKDYYQNSLTQSENELIQKVIDFLKENYDNHDVNINWLGNYFHISPSYLSRQFKEETGMSPLAYLTSLRIEKSQELLLTTQKTIAKIAEESGFLSNEVFIRTFKKETGITPGEFRKASQKQSEPSV